MTTENPPLPELTADQQKAVAAAEKFVKVLNDPKTEKAASTFGIGGAFFAKGTAGYSTADFTKLVAVTMATAMPRLLASQGTDISAWIQITVGLGKAGGDALKALSKLTANDSVYEELYRKYPVFTYTCNNGQLDFQTVFQNCATARQKAEDILQATAADPLFYAKFATFLYWGFGTRKDGEVWGNPTIYYPDVATGKTTARTFSNAQPSAKSLENADFVQSQNVDLKLPFYFANGIFNIDWVMESAQQFMYYYNNNLLDDNFMYCATIFDAAGFPNADTVRDETKANNYFFESFRQAAYLVEQQKKKEEQTTMFYYIIAIVVLLLLIYYYYSKK